MTRGWLLSMIGLRARSSGRPATPLCTLSFAAWQVLHWPPFSCHLGVHAVTVSPEASQGKRALVLLAAVACGESQHFKLRAPLSDRPWVDEKVTRASVCYAETGVCAICRACCWSIWCRRRNCEGASLTLYLAVLLSPSAQCCIPRQFMLFSSQALFCAGPPHA